MSTPKLRLLSKLVTFTVFYSTASLAQQEKPATEIEYGSLDHYFFTEVVGWRKLAGNEKLLTCVADKSVSAQRRQVLEIYLAGVSPDSVVKGGADGRTFSEGMKEADHVTSTLFRDIDFSNVDMCRGAYEELEVKAVAAISQLKAIHYRLIPVSEAIKRRHSPINSKSGLFNTKNLDCQKEVSATVDSLLSQNNRILELVAKGRGRVLHDMTKIQDYLNSLTIRKESCGDNPKSR